MSNECLSSREDLRSLLLFGVSSLECSQDVTTCRGMGRAQLVLVANEDKYRLPVVELQPRIISGLVVLSGEVVRRLPNEMVQIEQFQGFGSPAQSYKRALERLFVKEAPDFCEISIRRLTGSTSGVSGEVCESWMFEGQDQCWTSIVRGQRSNRLELVLDAITQGLQAYLLTRQQPS